MPCLHRFLALLLVTSVLAGASPTLIPPAAPALWERSELRLENIPAVENPFDPEQIRVDVLVTTPSNRVQRIPAYWTQDYEHRLVDGAEVLTPRGASGWRLRYTPAEAGEHQLQLEISLAGAAATPGDPITLVVPPSAPARQHGWVKIAGDRRFFATTDGRPLRLIGQNVCWDDGRGTFDYQAWFSVMAANGQNFARLWLSPWSLTLEHTPGTLNRYHLEGAAKLDQVLALAESHGIYLLLCFDHHGMYQLDNTGWGGTNNFWKTNPYNRVNGGPCANPNDFFTDPAAIALYQKRLRYLVARYGASDRLLAWQFFNEIDNVYAPRQTLVAADVTAWHRTMGQWFRAHDPYGHLITTSLTGGSDRPELWTLPEMDFTMYHSYTDPAPARTLAGLSESFVQRYKKPLMVGEFGVNPREWALESDPYLRGFRQAHWGALLGGSVGSAMAWWWEGIHRDDAYPLFHAMRGILERAGWFEGEWTPLSLAGQGDLPSELGEALTDAGTFSTPVALNAFLRRLTPIRGTLAIPDRLAAERASEYLSAVLHGSAQPALKKPLRLSAHFGSAGRLTYRVNAVAADLSLVVRIDGREVARTPLKDKDGLAQVNGELDQEFAVTVPAGRHIVEIDNEGPDWAFLDAVRLDGVRPAARVSGLPYAAQAVGQRTPDGKTAVLYVISPYTVYPANALRYHPPVQEGLTVEVVGWTGGPAVVEWFAPRDGRLLAETTAVPDQQTLRVPLPAFRDDLVGILHTR